MLPMPMGKFAAGCVCYLVSVLLVSYRDLKGNAAAAWIALVIGTMSVAMVFTTMAIYAKRGVN